MFFMTCFFVVVFRLTLGPFIGFNTWSFIRFITVRWFVAISGAPDIAKARKNDTDYSKLIQSQNCSPRIFTNTVGMVVHDVSTLLVHVVVLITERYFHSLHGNWSNSTILLNHQLVVFLISHDFSKKGAGTYSSCNWKGRGVQIVYPKGFVLLMV